MKPLITVVIPLHNYQDYISECIRSVQAQTLNNIEVFIINDASEDNSEAVALEAIKGDARFHVLKANFRNLSATRNFGIEQGTAPYICCIDSDDRMGSPDFLEVLVTALEQDRTIGIAFSSLTVMDIEGKLGHTPQWPNGFDADAQYAHINQMPTCNVFRREMWRRAGGYRPYFRMVEDAEFWTTCIDIGYSALHVTHEGLFHYRLHNKSASQVHRTGEVPEPDWLEWHPWAKDNQRPMAAGGKPPLGSWPVRFYNRPEVSVIIPVGVGHEQTLKDALHSVEGQTFRHWECIVVNDSGANLRLEDGFSWTKEVKTKGRLGAGAARNIGVKNSHAPFVVCLDADDLLKPRFLEATLAAYRQHGRYAYTDWISEEGQVKFEVHTTPEYSFQAVWERPSLHPVTTLIPRQWFEAVGGFDESMTAFEDVDFYMKLLVAGYCGVRVPEPLLIYHLQTGFRRQAGEKIKDQFKALLTKRYGAYMEGRSMCNCVEPPKGLQREAPTPENLEKYQASYGDMVKVQLTGEDAPLGQVTFLGPATHVSYGRRARGDIFYVWQKDVEYGEGIFTVLNDYVAEPAQTVIPPEPPELTEYPPMTVVEVIEQPELSEGDEVGEVLGLPVVIGPQRIGKPKAKARKSAKR